MEVQNGDAGVGLVPVDLERNVSDGIPPKGRMVLDLMPFFESNNRKAI